MRQSTTRCAKKGIRNAATGSSGLPESPLKISSKGTGILYCHIFQWLDVRRFRIVAGGHTWMIAPVSSALRRWRTWARRRSWTRCQRTPPRGSLNTIKGLHTSKLRIFVRSIPVKLLTRSGFETTLSTVPVPRIQQGTVDHNFVMSKTTKGMAHHNSTVDR